MNLEEKIVNLSDLIFVHKTEYPVNNDKILNPKNGIKKYLKEF